jgi:sulfur carrier protein ThiS
VESATDDEKARRRAESQQRAAVMAQLTAEVKLSVAKGELTLAEALAQAGIPLPEWLRTGASAPSGAPVATGEVEISATGKVTPQDQPAEHDAQKADPKEAKRAEAQRKLALMQRLPSEVKLRVAKGELTLADALREAGIDPESVA